MSTPLIPAKKLLAINQLKTDYYKIMNKLIFTHLFHSVHEGRVRRMLGITPPAAETRWSGSRLRLVRRRLVRRHRGRSGAADLLYKNNLKKKNSHFSFSPQLQTVPKYKLLTGFTAPGSSPWAHMVRTPSSTSDSFSTSYTSLNN